MKCFSCICGQPLFFANTQCLSCRRLVGFDPRQMEMMSLEPGSRRPGSVAEVYPSASPAAMGRRFRHCEHRSSGVCNWLVLEDDPLAYCEACRLNETIPNQSVPENWARWQALEQAKRRLLYTLRRLQLPKLDEIRFAFLEDQRTNPTVNEAHVATGHTSGLITINVAEADPAYSEHQRRLFGESYRTVLGHFRHESGHFYWEHLIGPSPVLLAEFQQHFGDHTQDYHGALEAFYARSVEEAQGGYTAEFVSAYASAHPLEDWAEVWAHMLHIVDALETATAYGLSQIHWQQEDFSTCLSEWATLSVALNELNRGLGLSDPYPFSVTPEVSKKLLFTRRVSAGEGASIRCEEGR